MPWASKSFIPRRGSAEEEGARCRKSRRGGEEEEDVEEVGERGGEGRSSEIGLEVFMLALGGRRREVV